MEREECELLIVQVGFKQGCVMYPWLFNLSMDGVTKEVNGREMGRVLLLAL